MWKYAFTMLILLVGSVAMGGKCWQRGNWVREHHPANKVNKYESKLPWSGNAS